MTLTQPDFDAYPVWGDRLAAFRGTIWQSAALHSIAAEAERSGEADYESAARSAAEGCPVSLRDLELLIAEDMAESSSKEMPADYYWRQSQYAIDAGMGE